MNFREDLGDVKRIVIKVGSNVITKPNGKCDLRRMRIIVEDICELMEADKEVILVSSGAINVGKAFLDEYLPNRIELQQSASAIGQPKLIYKYTSLFEENSRVCSQILLTHDDFRDKRRFLNAKKTLEVLLQNRVVPILNENDTISFAEITVGDNDHLAAQASQMVTADLLLIVTSQNGLYDRNPTDPEARLIKYVRFGESLDHIDMSDSSASGRGGMSSKVEAVKKATELGVKCLISSKDNERIILDPLTKDLATFFDVNKDPHSERRAWMVSTMRRNCAIEVDTDTYQALLANQSLFPDGIVATKGSFQRGDCVAIRHKNRTFALGVSEFDRGEVALLQSKAGREVIFRANMIIQEGVRNAKNSKKI